ncbi:MAG: hypothetical protein ACREBD_14235, partial [Blastocatellia bacterium]
FSRRSISSLPVTGEVGARQPASEINAVSESAHRDKTVLFIPGSWRNILPMFIDGFFLSTGMVGFANQEHQEM